ncbi:effector binding domain-containing protein [Paenibacillus terreus]|uniref:Effector binding domain-containing protein n=1 Tax=Paenibacillus terreus TaxID=1387834 RepID=A0ABV5BH44_9BACL
MDYYKSIQSAVDYMEANLQKAMDIRQIAGQAGFSPFHFQRLFQAISGFSVQEYIRKRRLTEAAVVLRNTDAAILDTALSYQYQSQEAFTRAFEQFCGVTPARYRKAEPEPGIARQTKLDFLKFRELTIKGEMKMNKPNLVHLENIPILGVRYKTTLEDERYFAEIPGFYHDFGMNQYFLQIPDKAAPDFSYGIACDFQDDGEFSFVVGEATNSLVTTPDLNWFSFELPGGLHAEFKIDGTADDTQNVRKYIYGVWLPNSNYIRREGPDFEVTDVLGSRYPDRMKMSIYIPIK